MRRVDHDLDESDWGALVSARGGCACCGGTGTGLQRDRILPVSRGGRYTLDNVVPACRSRNASKCTSEVTGRLRRKRLDERAFLTRHREMLEQLPPPQ
jgi:5-methylcytosine-specific restriction endonuclease McrA